MNDLVERLRRRVPAHVAELSIFTEAADHIERLNVLLETAKGLKHIVEEIDGMMNHGTWRDENGFRFKDTPEWVVFYNALHNASSVEESKI